jgi:hypothetical protein
MKPKQGSSSVSKEYFSTQQAAKNECLIIQGGSNMTGTNCDLFTHNQSRSYLNHLVISSGIVSYFSACSEQRCTLMLRTCDAICRWKCIGNALTVVLLHNFSHSLWQQCAWSSCAKEVCGWNNSLFNWTNVQTFQVKLSQCCASSRRSRNREPRFILWVPKGKWTCNIFL